MSNRLSLRTSSGAVLARLIEDPGIASTIQAMEPSDFFALVRHVGVEDAGEIVAFATTEQLVAVFDEDLFSNEAPGEPELFSSSRFLTWLEVLQEAGDDVTANRITELSMDFVVHALHSIVLVLNHDDLLLSMSDGGHAAYRVDKALESALCEEIDGYLLISRNPDGWDAVMSLILALDRDHRDYLEQILDRCSVMAAEYIDDLDSLSSLLSMEASLAEDVADDREQRREQLGHVEPRDASAFLKLATRPIAEDAHLASRDPITKAHFRNLPAPLPIASHGTAAVFPAAMPLHLPAPPKADAFSTCIEGLRLLNDSNPVEFGRRMQELAYLANVIAAGTPFRDRRFRPSEAAEAAISTVTLGIAIAAAEQNTTALSRDVHRILETCAADILFRKASGYLTAQGIPSSVPGIVTDKFSLRSLLADLWDKPANARGYSVPVE